MACRVSGFRRLLTAFIGAVVASVAALVVKEQGAEERPSEESRCAGMTVTGRSFVSFKVLLNTHQLSRTQTCRHRLVVVQRQTGCSTQPRRRSLRCHPSETGCDDKLPSVELFINRDWIINANFRLSRRCDVRKRF